MAFFRGGEMSARELGLYSDSLADEFPNDCDDVIATLKHLERHRGDYERIIPAMPELVAMVRARRSEKKRKIREAAERERYEADRRYWQERRLNERSSVPAEGDAAPSSNEGRGRRGGSNL
jgi:hypothetical protein